MGRPQPLTLALSCSSCHKPVNLLYERGDELTHVTWTCPHASCRKPQAFELKGRMVSVLASGDTPPS